MLSRIGSSRVFADCIEGRRPSSIGAGELDECLGVLVLVEDDWRRCHSATLSTPPPPPGGDARLSPWPSCSLSIDLRWVFSFLSITVLSTLRLRSQRSFAWLICACSASWRDSGSCIARMRSRWRWSSSPIVTRRGAGEKADGEAGFCLEGAGRGSGMTTTPPEDMDRERSGGPPV